MNGFYSAYFTRTHGSGFGVFVLRDGILAGVDPTGSSFDGEYRLNAETGTYDGTIVMNALPDTILVTGAQVGAEAVQFPIPVRLPLDFDNGQVIGVETPTGPINVSFHKLRELT